MVRKKREIKNKRKSNNYLKIMRNRLKKNKINASRTKKKIVIFIGKISNSNW